MKTEQEKQPAPAPVLAWHEETVKAIHPWIPADEGIGTLAEMQEAYDENEANLQEDNRIAAIIATHDPHAETVRLLEEVNNRLNYTINRKLHDEVRIHLAKLKGTQ